MTKKLKELLPQIHRRESFRFTLITVLSSAKIDLIFDYTKFFRKNKADASPEPFPKRQAAGRSPTLQRSPAGRKNKSTDCFF